MSRLARVQADLQEVSAAVARAERTLAAHPDVPSVAATLRTIERRRDSLQEEFVAAANELGLDTCAYRLEFDHARQATILGLTAVLGAFQKAFTAVYDSVIHGAKQRATASAETVAASSFGFAYSFPGSIGIMMTLPNERLLVDESQLDTAMSRTLSLMKAQTPREIESMTETVGVAAVRQTYQWAIENAKAGFGADIVWRREESTKLELRMQPQEISELTMALGAAIAREQVTLVGDLLHVNMYDRTFQMSGEGRVINGTFDDAISSDKPAQLPKRYLATLTVMTRVVVAEGQEEASYHLVRLADPPAVSMLSDFLSL